MARTSRTLVAALAGPLLAAALAVACGGTGRAADANLSPDAREGLRIASEKGCFACHGLRGIGGIAGGWNRLYGAEITLADGSTVRADDFYLRQSIRSPNAARRAGTKDVMPDNSLSDAQIEAVIAYIQALRDA